MSPTRRPYLQHSTNALQEVFRSYRDDPVRLSLLIAELRHRNRPGARALLSAVEKQICELQARVGVQPVAGTTAVRDAASSAVQAPAGESSIKPSTPTTRPEPPALRDQHSSPIDPEILRKRKLIEPIGVQGRPPKYMAQPKTDVKLNIPETMSRAARYTVALNALIEDMQRHGQGGKRLLLENGRRIELDHGHRGYSFDFGQEADLFEDARVELHVGNRRIEGQIVSISSGKIIVTVDDDLGEFLNSCLLLIDNTALLEALKERLEKVGVEGRALNA